MHYAYRIQFACTAGNTIFAFVSVCLAYMYVHIYVQVVILVYIYFAYDYAQKAHITTLSNCNITLYLRFVNNTHLRIQNVSLHLTIYIHIHTQPCQRAARLSAVESILNGGKTGFNCQARQAAVFCLMPSVKMQNINPYKYIQTLWCLKR